MSRSFIRRTLIALVILVAGFGMAPATAALLVGVGPPQPDSLSASEKAALSAIAAGSLALSGIQVVRLDGAVDVAAARNQAVQSGVDYLIIVTNDASRQRIGYDSYRPGPNVIVGHIDRTVPATTGTLTASERATLFPRSFKRTVLIAPETGTDNGLADKDFINAYFGALLNAKNVASYAATMEFNQFQTPTLAQQSQQAQVQQQGLLQQAQLAELRKQTLLMMSLSTAILSQQSVATTNAVPANNKQASSAVSTMNAAVRQLNEQIRTTAETPPPPTISFAAPDIASYATELCRIYNADGVFVWHVSRATYTQKLFGRYTSDVAMKGQEFNCNAEQIWSAKGTGQKSAFTSLGSALVSTFNLAVALKPKIDSTNAQNTKPLVSPYLDLTDSADKAHFDYDAVRIAMEKIVENYP